MMHFHKVHLVVISEAMLGLGLRHIPGVSGTFGGLVKGQCHRTRTLMGRHREASRADRDQNRDATRDATPR